MRRLLISFSGGETSAYMAQRILSSHAYDEVRIVFANTGEENEETLRFVDECDRHFSLGVVWIEAVQRHEYGKGPTHRVVDFSSASRNGEPFEDFIRKYGIPNQKAPQCTDNLKGEPIKNYARSIGWRSGSYDLAIGIRADEIDRMSSKSQRDRIVYPLIKWGITKPKVNEFWASMPFRLQLKGYQGNCKWCWKKSMRKHLTIMAENPRAFDFPERMEREYPRVGTEFRKNVPGVGPRTFFRGNRSVQDIRGALATNPNFVRAEDDSQALPDLELDLGGGCEESCEVFGA